MAGSDLYGSEHMQDPERIRELREQAAALPRNYGPWQSDDLDKVRRALRNRLRFNVLKRDYFTCQYCGAMPPAVKLQVDHIIPVAEGGETEMRNLITACQPCNSGKGRVPLGDRGGTIREVSVGSNQND